MKNADRILASTIASSRKVSATASSFVRVEPPPEEPRLSARVIYEYEATSPYELSVAGIILTAKLSISSHKFVRGFHCYDSRRGRWIGLG